MKKSLNVVALVVLSTFAVAPVGAAYAADIMNDKQCQNAVKDTEEAIHENPTLGDKAEKILMDIMALAKKRCDEKQYSNAKDLLDLARGMVASESGSEVK